METQGKVTGVPDAVVTFAQTAQGQHTATWAAWTRARTGAGKQAVSGVDVTVKKGVDKAFAKVMDVPGLATLALDLENVVVVTYIAAIGVVKSPQDGCDHPTGGDAARRDPELPAGRQNPVPDAFGEEYCARPVSDKIG